RELSGTVVSKQATGNGPVDAGSAVIPLPGCREAFAVALGSKVEVVHHKQVEITVTIVVQEGCTRTPALVIDSRLVRDVGEGAVAVVGEKDFGSKFRHVQTKIAIIVIITDRTPHAVTFMLDSRLRSNIHKAKLAAGLQIIAEKSMAARLAGW